MMLHLPSWHLDVIYRSILCGILLLCGQFELHASPASNLMGNIQGKIFDQATLQPLAGALVQLDSLPLQGFSNELGIVQFDHLPVGKHHLRVSYLGYERVEVEVVVSDAQTVSFEAGLLNRPIQLEEVSIADTRRPSGKLTHIQALDWQLRPMKSGQDLLRIVPGLFIAQHAGGGKAEQIFFRGFDIDHGTDLSLSVDGVPVNMVSHAHGQGYADLHFVIPETLEGMSVGKGPYSSQYGNFATAGFVDLTTKDALAESQVTLELGQFQTARLLGMTHLRPAQSNQQAYLAVEHRFSEGYFDAPQGFYRTNVFGKYTAELGVDTRMSLSISHFDSEWNASGQIPQRAVRQGLISRFGAIDSTEGGATKRTNVNLQWTHVGAKGAIWKQQWYVSRYDFELYSNFTFLLEDPIHGDQIRQRERRNVFGGQGSMKAVTPWGRKSLQTEIGYQLRFDQVQESELSQTLNRTTTLGRLALGNIRESQAAMFGNQRYDLSQQWDVQLGLRYDLFRFAYEDHLDPLYLPQTQVEGVLSPKFLVNYHPNNKLRLYGKLGRGFHSNDTRVILNQGQQAILPKAYGVDIGANLKPAPNLLLRAAVWGLWMQEELVYVGDAAIVEPGGPTQRLGLDLSGHYQLGKWLIADASLTITRARLVGVESSASFIPLAPSFTQQAGLKAQITKGFEGSIRYRHLADRPANETYSLSADGYHLLDVSMAYQRGRYRLGLTIENLANVEWAEAQFETESRLPNEVEPVTEIHFTPGSPFFARLALTVTM